MPTTRTRNTPRGRTPTRALAPAPAFRRGPPPPPPRRLRRSDPSPGRFRRGRCRCTPARAGCHTIRPRNSKPPEADRPPFHMSCPARGNPRRSRGSRRSCMARRIRHPRSSTPPGAGNPLRHRLCPARETSRNSCRSSSPSMTRRRSNRRRRTSRLHKPSLLRGNRRPARCKRSPSGSRSRSRSSTLRREDSWLPHKLFPDRGTYHHNSSVRSACTRRSVCSKPLYIGPPCTSSEDLRIRLPGRYKSPRSTGCKTRSRNRLPWGKRCSRPHSAIRNPGRSHRWFRS